MKVKPSNLYYVAEQVTVDNIEAVARWSGGSIKGTSLPAQAMEIEIVNLEGDELRARVGDWVIRRGFVKSRLFYEVHDDETFLSLYKEHP